MIKFILKKSLEKWIIKFQDDNDENDETLDNIQLPKAKKAPAKKAHQVVAPSQQTSSAVSPPTQQPAEKTTTKTAVAETRTSNSQAASGIPKTGSQMNITMAANEIGRENFVLKFLKWKQ